MTHVTITKLFIDYCADMSDLRNVVYIYSLRTDSWKAVHDQLQGIFLINHLGKFVNGKLYWTASTRLCNFNVPNIISFDVVDEKWGSLELPFVEKSILIWELGSDLSLIYTCGLGATTSDIWILKNSGIHVSWMRRFTIEYPKNAGLHMGSRTSNPFSIHLRQSNKGDILPSFPRFILIFGSSTRKLEHTVDIVGCDPAEIYAESMEVEANSVLAAECMDRNGEALYQTCSSISYNEDSYNLVPTCTQRMLKETLWIVPLLLRVKIHLFRNFSDVFTNFTGSEISRNQSPSLGTFRMCLLTSRAPKSLEINLHLLPDFPHLRQKVIESDAYPKISAIFLKIDSVSPY